MDQEKTKISISISKHAYFVSGLRDFIMNFVKNMTGFSEKWAYRFQSVVDELASNAVEHGCKDGDEIRVSFIYTKDKSLELEIEDPGHGDKKVKALDLQKMYKEKLETFASNTQFMGIRGRGLAQIVSPWSDEITFSDSSSGGIIIKVVKYLKEEDRK
jgi:anti-sigma regulatory factor (Ser/Thr protein kinase)